MRNNLHRKGFFLAIFGAILWGISGTTAQFLFQQKNFTAKWLVVIRLLFSGMILVLLGIAKSDCDIFKIWHNRKDSIKLLLFGILGMLGVQYTYFSAISYGNAATATILQYLSPIVITLFVAISSKTLPSLKQIVVIIFALMGTFLIITKGSLNSLAISQLALFWGIASAFASALYTLQPISLLKKYTSTSIVGWGMIIGGIAFSFVKQPWNCSGIWDLQSVLAIIFVVIFGTLIAFLIYLKSLKYIKPTEASILGSLEPLSATLLSIIYLKEPFDLVQSLGMILIITSIAVLSYVKKTDRNTY